MEFGRVPEKELSHIKFKLPADPVFNKAVLNGKPLPKAKVWMGCAKWGRREWIGKIYPPKTREKDFLKYYVQHYNSIELNATHHKIWGAKGTAQWASFAKGHEFLFCPKMYQGITHKGKLIGKTFLSNEFFRGIAGLGKHLGPVFVQVSELFSPKRKDELFTYLKSLPKGIQFFLEVRHPDWFAKKEIAAELFDFLRDQNIGAVITDTAGRRDCAHMKLPIAKTFIRFVGNSLHPSDFKRCDEWVKRIKNWLKNGISEVYFFMHMHDEAQSPELTVYLAEQLNKHCKLDLVVPDFSMGKLPVKKTRRKP